MQKIFDKRLAIDLCSNFNYN